MKERITSLLLVFVMFFTLAPVNASAMVSGDDGNAQDTYPVGGMLIPDAVEISQETAEKIGIVREQDLQSGGQLQKFSANYGSQQYASSWDVYSSNYVYNRLGEKERKFWDLLDAQCKSYLDSTKNAKREYIGWNAYSVAEGIDFSVLGWSSEYAREIYQLFIYANPQYYFLDGGCLYTSKVLLPEFYDSFANGMARKTQSEAVLYQLNLMKAEVQAGATDLEKARIAHDLIIQRVNYDTYYNTNYEHTPYHQSAYSVFCDSYTVCAGYTKAFEMLLNAVGIDTIGVTSSKEVVVNGEIKKEGLHAWNAVCLNDSWYYVDCTWDDLDGREGMELMYLFFGLSYGTITGIGDQDGAHIPDSYYNGLLPACTRDMGSTVEEIGTPYVPAQAVAAPRIVQQRAKNGISVTLKSDTPGADIYYTTDGKDPSASFTRSYHYTKPFVVSSDVTLKAIAVCDGKMDSRVSAASVKGLQYTVKFNTQNGSKVSAQKIWPQGVVTKPADPKRKNYQFDGWYSDRNCKTKWKFGSKVTKNMTLYAKWTKVKVAQANIRSLKNKSGGKLNVAIRKVSGAKGYQIRYSTKSSMGSPRKVMVKNIKKTLSGLKKGQTYYVQARAYKLDSAKNRIYGKWGGKKAVTVRK